MPDDPHILRMAHLRRVRNRPFPIAPSDRRGMDPQPKKYTEDSAWPIPGTSPPNHICVGKATLIVLRID